MLQHSRAGNHGWNRNRAGSGLRALLVVVLAAACARPALSQAAPAATVRWVGCDISRLSFMDDMAEAFERKTGNRIEVEEGGATRGIRDVAAGKAEMGGSCRHAFDLPEERGVKLVPVAWDALVVVVHPSNPVTDVTRDQLRGILTGKITNWKELGGRDAPVEVFERKGKLSGVGFGTRSLLFGNPEQDFTPTARIFDSTSPLEGALEGTPNGVAVTGISSARLRKLKMLAIEGRLPTRENVINGRYLLYRPLYLTVADNPSPVASQFIKFLFSKEGQAIMKRTGTVTLAEGKDLWEPFKQQVK